MRIVKRLEFIFVFCIFMLMKKAAKARGRPAKAADDQQIYVPVRFPGAMIAAIDAESSARLDAPSRSTVIRELVALGLETLRAKKGKK